jgi:signal transduction histidine kinase
MKTILLADDEENLRTLVRTTLDQPGYRILESEDGAAALALARRERPDVVVLDWMMPGMTGLEVMAALRRDGATAHIPIILLTAKGQREDYVQAVASGASAYLVKPFSPLELLGMVEELCRECADVAAATRPSVAGVGSASDAAASSQLALYARDLARMVDAERDRAQELAAANARLQLLDQLKSDFLTFISHELRTPLALIGAFDLYDTEADPAERARVTEIIRAGYQRLNDFVGRGLEYFDWLAGECTPADQLTDLAALVRELVAGMPELGADATTYTTTLPAEPCRVRGAAAPLATCIRSLLENAVKFSSPPAHVVITLEETNGTATLIVSDRGRGFPPALAPELLRPFTVLDTLHHARGTGLSLALSAAILQAHGGAIRAESEGLDRGARFTVTLPVATDPPAERS